MPEIQTGNLVKVIDGAFTGMIGFLMETDGEWARLRVGGGEIILVNSDFIEAF